MGKTITTYLIDGDPKGTQYVFISNKICQMFVIPRSSLSILNDIQYLKCRAIAIAKKTKQYSLEDSKQTPNAPNLPEYQKDNMDEFFAEICFLANSSYQNSPKISIIARLRLYLIRNSLTKLSTAAFPPFRFLIHSNARAMYS